jgi:hypothetical protein
MVMLGADFFHVGYFNVTGATGWPNGKGPNDPRGYIYQAAMPAYAQAIASQVWEFFDKGVLLEDPLSKEQRMPFTFAASASNHLVLVRKLDKKYLIYGSVQPSSNYKGNTVLEATTSITLEGKKISFNIRRQGSMYVLDLSGAQPVFYQLDGWHQYEHPYYWSKAVEIEAENVKALTGLNLITEKGTAPENDFSDFATYVQMVPGKSIGVNIPKKRYGELSLSFSAKSANGNVSIIFKSASGTIRKTISSGDLKEITFTPADLHVLQLKPGERLTLGAENGNVLLDKLRF